MNKFSLLFLAVTATACTEQIIEKEYITVVADDTGHDHDLEDHDHDLEDHDHDHDHEVPDHTHPEYEIPDPEPEPEFCDLAVDCTGYFYVQDNFELEEVRQCKTIVGNLYLELYNANEEPTIDADLPCLTEVTGGLSVYGYGINSLEFPLLEKVQYLYIYGYKMAEVPAFESLVEADSIQLSYFARANTISGFNNVQSLNYLYISSMYDWETGSDYSVAGLETIEGFNSIETINEFNLTGTSVSSVEGFASITESATYTYITNNPNLCQTDAEELADSIGVDGTYMNVYGNYGPCD